MDALTMEFDSQFYIEIEPVFPLKRWSNSAFIEDKHCLPSDDTVKSTGLKTLRSEAITESRHKETGKEYKQDRSWSELEHGRTFYQLDDSTTMKNWNNLTKNHFSLEEPIQRQPLTNYSRLLFKDKSCVTAEYSTFRPSESGKHSELPIIEEESAAFIEIEPIILPYSPPPTYEEAMRSYEPEQPPEEPMTAPSEATNSNAESSMTVLYVPELPSDFFSRHLTLYHLERSTLSFTPGLQIIDEDSVLEIEPCFFMFESSEKKKGFAGYMKRKFQRMCNFFKKLKN